MPVPENKKRNNRMEKLFLKGISKRAIARMEGLHHKTVQEILERRGYPAGVKVKSRS